MKSIRTIFWLVEAPTRGYALPIDGLPADIQVGQILKSMLSSYPGDLYTRKIEDYQIFDWDCVPLKSGALIGSVPRPGVINTVLNVSPNSLLSRDGHEAYMSALRAKSAARRVSELTSFLSSSDADYEPLGTHEFDVFVSYSSEDTDLASEIYELLRTAGLSCFLAAKALRAGTMWMEKVRDALRSCRVVVLLLTRNSYSSPWVMSEAGAAWGLGKPLVPVMQGMPTGEWPELVAQYQGRSIGTQDDRSRLLAELTSLCKA